MRPYKVTSTRLPHVDGPDSLLSALEIEKMPLTRTSVPASSASKRALNGNESVNKDLFSTLFSSDIASLE
ncbi:hypothetical protein E4T56_gene9608, partial [Termitomyces sp. T112]